MVFHGSVFREMIEITQWRSRIGLWNCCAGAAFNKLSFGKQASSSKTAAPPIIVASKLKAKETRATSVDEMMLKFPSIFYQGIFLSLFAFVSRFLIGVVGFCNFQPQQVQLTGATLRSPSSINQMQSLVGAVTLSFVLYVFLCLCLILLSGDVELNPGPTIDDKPDLSLILEWLEPLHDWQSFGLLLPGVTQQDITTIEEFDTSTSKGKTGLFSKWLKKYPTATWKDVLDALYKKEEHKLLGTIEDHLCGNPAILKIFRNHYASLASIISTNLAQVTNALYAEELIPMNIVEDMLVEGIGSSKKASKLLLVITQHLESSQNRAQYLIDICYVLANQEHKALADISAAILHDLGCACVMAERHIDLPVVPNIVLEYANNLRQCYKDQPIVNADWPPRIGEDFFGRLALVENQSSTIKDRRSAWYLLRGQVDEIIEMPENKEVHIEDILKPTKAASSLRVVIDGPPGIGKTTLCRKLLNMWSHGSGQLPYEYDLVLYCPLRYREIAAATTLADLLVHYCYEASVLVEWFEKRNGKGLLIIFDGWDELSMSSRSSSFVLDIICRKRLSQCSVIVTSRSYASSSLLKIDSITRYIQVIGFRKEEIAIVIIQKIQKDPELALELIEAYKEMINNQDFDDDSSSDRINVDFKWLELELRSNSDSQLAVKLINDLEVRDDVRSLCYIPLICSIVLLVYCKANGSLPTTLTQLYETFIVQTIKRQAEKSDNDAYDLPNTLLSLPSQPALQELCQLAYTNLAENKLIFSSDQLKEWSLGKEDYLGLITSFTEFGGKKYQFLHLSIQEFLAAWWIAKHEKKTEEVFKNHFDDDHFRMCLRFVAGLTNLEHESYEQYFNKQLELKCKKLPMYKYWNHVLPHFYQYPEAESYHNSPAMLTLRFDYIPDENTNFPVLLFQLLYESQNAMLCHTLAQSINDQSLCLKGALLSLFDWLCFNYFISNSSIKWKHLHLVNVFNNQELSIFNNTLTHISPHTTCERLQISFHEPYDEFLDRFFLSSFLKNIQELYCELDSSTYDLGLALLHILSLPDLKIFHFDCNAVDSMFKTYQCDVIEKCVATKVTLQELKVIFYLGSGMKIVTSIIKGVTKSNTIKSFMVKLIVDDDLPPPPHPVPDKVLEDLLKDNYTLEALSMIIPDYLIESYPIFEINAPLTALELHAGYQCNLLTHLVLADELRELFANQILIVSRAPLHFVFHPNLKSLYSPEAKANMTIDIFRSFTIDTPELAVTVKFRNGQAWFKKYEY